MQIRHRCLSAPAYHPLWNILGCPHCEESKRLGRLQGKTTRPGLFKCYACKKPFTVRMGTILESSPAAPPLAPSHPPVLLLQERYRDFRWLFNCYDYSDEIPRMASEDMCQNSRFGDPSVTLRREFYWQRIVTPTMPERRRRWLGARSPVPKCHAAEFPTAQRQAA
jgi:uncharacterized protein YbaR (Trm112 family)